MPLPGIIRVRFFMSLPMAPLVLGAICVVAQAQSCFRTCSSGGVRLPKCEDQNGHKPHGAQTFCREARRPRFATGTGLFR